MNVDILTLDSHGLLEIEQKEKLTQFVEMVKKEKPSIIELQEVKQNINALVHPSVMLKGYTRYKGNSIVLRVDNCASELANRLFENGLSYYWTWIPVKLGEGEYEKGVAFFSDKPILETMPVLMNRVQMYQS